MSHHWPWYADPCPSRKSSCLNHGCCQVARTSLSLCKVIVFGQVPSAHCQDGNAPAGPLFTLTVSVDTIDSAFNLKCVLGVPGENSLLSQISPAFQMGSEPHLGIAKTPWKWLGGGLSSQQKAARNPSASPVRFMQDPHPSGIRSKGLMEKLLATKYSE